MNKKLLISFSILFSLLLHYAFIAWLFQKPESLQEELAFNLELIQENWNSGTNLSGEATEPQGNIVSKEANQDIANLLSDQNLKPFDSLQNVFEIIKGINRENFSIASSQNQKTINEQDKGDALKKNPRPNNFLTGNDFEVNLEYQPKANNQGYLFKLAVSPKKNVSFSHLSQDIWFLIDCSMPTDKFDAAKYAVAEALTSLQPGDSFNIIFFDEDTIALTDASLTVSEFNLIKAYEFLSKNSPTTYPHNLQKALNQLKPSVENQKVQSSILITEAAGNLNLDSDGKFLKKWTQKNNGNFAVHSILTTEQEACLAFHKLLNATNKGLTIQANNDRELFLALKTLVKQIQKPIINQVAAFPVDPTNNLQISIAPIVQRLPNMYEDAPYHIYGTIDRLDDFDIVFLGKRGDQQVEIRQSLKFKNAVLNNDPNFEKNCVLEQAYDEYDRYLRTEEYTYLQAAQEILKSNNLQPLVKE